MAAQLVNPGLTVSERPHGFWYLWLKYVDDFDPRHHCLKCLIGLKSRRIGLDSPWLTPDKSVPLIESRSPFLYLCGGAGYGYRSQSSWNDNLHVALIPKAGASTSVTTYNGIVFTFTNAEQVAIPDLPLGFKGLPSKYTTCRNFRFGVAHFPERDVATFVPSPGVARASVAPQLELGGDGIRSALEVVKVVGSKGDVYDVVRTGAGYRCPCLGYRYNRTCSHVRKVMAGAP